MTFKPIVLGLSIALLSGCATLDLAPTNIFMNDPAEHAGRPEARFPGSKAPEARPAMDKGVAP